MTDPVGNPVVIGLYGVSGSGKTYLLNQLKEKLGEEQFTFYDGSAIISNVVEGGLGVFQRMDDVEKRQSRNLAIDRIKKECISSQKAAVVAGHFMLWDEDKESGQEIWTENDQIIYTHILYLDVSPEDVVQRRQNDAEKGRPDISSSSLRKWQDEEKAKLRDRCREHGILFSLLVPSSELLEKTASFLQDFRVHTETNNTTRAVSRLDNTKVATQNQIKTVFVLDADKTLTAVDTGALFWKEISDLRPSQYGPSTLKELFGGKLRRSYTAFRQAMLLYEEACTHGEFDALCEKVASIVIMHADFINLLQFVREQRHIGAVVITSGLRHVWEKVLKKEGLSGEVEVIGGGRIEDEFVVTKAVKTALVAQLKRTHRKTVWAFGDGPLDLGMLHEADRAIVVVGEKEKEKGVMEVLLSNAIDVDGLRARQVLLPKGSLQLLDPSQLPVIRLSDPEFVDSFRDKESTDPGLDCKLAESTAMLLATQMRDANVAGRDLREVHRRAGWYLANEYVSKVVGLEPSPIMHVQGRRETGSRLFHEAQTTIVALMRGGEPMAFGVSDAFPKAMFVHAREPEDIISQNHLQGQLTVVLVDSVINEGKTIVKFVQHIRKLHATIRIVIVAGVVQADCILKGTLNDKLAPCAKVHLVALRQSETSFVGTRATDTGNRLFNTTHLD